MKKLAVLSCAALLGAGAITSSGAQARDRGGAIAAGVIGGLAAGALIGAAASNAHAAPAYGYGYPAHGYSRFPHHGYHDDGVYPGHHHKRVVVRRFVHDYPEDCRVIVKQRYNRLGELVVKRIQICD